MTDINGRFRLFIEKTGLTPSKFASEIGINHESINRIIRSGKFPPSVNIIAACKRRWPTLNANYLISGEDGMFLSDQPVSYDVMVAEMKQLKESNIAKDKTIEQLTNLLSQRSK